MSENIKEMIPEDKHCLVRYIILSDPSSFIEKSLFCNLASELLQLNLCGNVTKRSYVTGISSITLSDSLNNNLSLSVGKMRTFTGCNSDGCSCPKGLHSSRVVAANRGDLLN